MNRKFLALKWEMWEKPKISRTKFQTEELGQFVNFDALVGLIKVVQRADKKGLALGW
jgi:hypothetical protein